jgi:hypothetical protein
MKRQNYKQKLILSFHIFYLNLIKGMFSLFCIFYVYHHKEISINSYGRKLSINCIIARAWDHLTLAVRRSVVFARFSVGGA